ncbi:MAG TPA: hypothetical protein PKD55_11330 [Bellilinea sp.]|nr:hypothetical protein [Bellilinea sp.]
MKKILTILVTLTVLFSMTIAPVLAQEPPPLDEPKVEPVWGDNDQASLDAAMIDEAAASLNGANLDVQLSSTLSYLWVTPWDMQILGDYPMYNTSFDCAASAGIYRGHFTVPEGSRIMWLRFYYIDRVDPGYVTMTLRWSRPGKENKVLATVSSTDTEKAGYAERVVKVDVPTSNFDAVYLLNGYSSGADVTADKAICGVRIAYYPPVLPQIYLPIVGSP